MCTCDDDRNRRKHQGRGRRRHGSRDRGGRGCRCGCRCGCNCGCNCGCGCGDRCGCGCKDSSFDFKRRFTSKAEVMGELERYLEQLEAEADGVKERIAELKVNQAD